MTADCALSEEVTLNLTPGSKQSGVPTLIPPPRGGQRIIAFPGQAFGVLEKRRRLPYSEPSRNCKIKEVGGIYKDKDEAQSTRWVQVAWDSEQCIQAL